MMNVTYGDNAGVYAEAVTAGDQLYLSGLISQDWNTGAVITGTIEEETERVLCNMKKMLEKYGSGMDKLIRVEIFLTDFSERDRMNGIYLKHFPAGRLPSRLCVGVTGLACGCKVEMMAHAWC